MNTGIKQMSKVRIVLVLIALFLSTMCTMGDMVIVPIAANLYEVFESTALVNAIISGPAVTGMLFCIIGGIMVDKMDKKLVMVLGFAIFTVSSVFGAAIQNVWYVLICRLLATGVAWGLTSTAAFAIIADMFTEEKKHGTVVGWYNAAMALIGAALSFIAGNLALHGWTAAYRTYWAAIPILIMLFLVLPADPPAAGAASKEKVRGEAGWASRLIPFLVEIFLIAACYYVIVYVIAVYVADTGIGNEAFTGTLSSVGTITSCIACICFGFVFAKLKKFTPLPSMVILGVGFLLMAFFPSKGIAVFACAIMGAAWGIYYSYLYAHCTDIVPVKMQGKALGITGAVNGIASFFCTYMLTGFQSVMKADSSAKVFPIFGIICLAVFVVTAIVIIRRKDDKPREENAA